VPFESHSLTAEQLAAIAFSEWHQTFDPKHFEILVCLNLKNDLELKITFLK